MGTYSVFVLGTGASATFGYPLGKTLVEDIGALRPSDKTGLPPESFGRFKQALRLSAANSVDVFLERNPEFIDIGRLAIANVLIGHEQPSVLWSEMRHDPLIRKDYPIDNWYKYLFNRLVDGVPFERVSGWPIAFITFNYDRSLEYFLCEAIKNLYAKSEDDAAKSLENIPFIHVHGHLGLLPWQKGNLFKRDYSATATPEGLVAASQQIKILHEADESSNEFEEARRLLGSADRIYVLGFGYHRTNVQRLKLLHNATRVQPLGTSVGLTPEEKQSIASKGCNVGFPSVEEPGIIPFLRRNEKFLNTAWTY